ncbi:HAD family hydrolase [Dokdonella soli]|uniref:Phosphonatase-like hydrolase n=1 Tax=Dokdonella soli TaxID=529810 RepID=A0ABP3TWV0_9GAMM
MVMLFAGANMSRHMGNSMNYKMVVFDMAGTTVRDPGLVARALVGALADDGCAVDEAAAQPLMGYKKPEAIRRLLLAQEQRADADRVERIHGDFVTRMLRCYQESDEVAPMADAQAVFAELRRSGMRVALNTAFSRSIADAIVERFGWLRAGVIDDLIATDEVPAGRPEPHMIRTLMARQGLTDARSVVKVGDTEVDIREGRNAGAGLVVAVTTGAFTRQALLPFEPDHIIDRLQDLPGLL